MFQNLYKLYILKILLNIYTNYINLSPAISEDLFAPGSPHAPKPGQIGALPTNSPLSIHPTFIPG